MGEGKRQDWWREMIDRVMGEAGQRPGKTKMAAYCVRPGQKFLTQQQDEEIVLLLRAHPITNIPWILMVLVMVALPSLLELTGIFVGIPWPFVFVGKLFWYLVTLAFVFEKFLHWYYSVFIVTNERIIDIDFVNLVYRVMTDANLNHIEETEMVTGGFIRSIFQYGDVYVTTASEIPSMEANDVPWPQKVVDVISRLSEELEKRRERGE